MAAPRKKEPFIQKGDAVHIQRPGNISGTWKVLAARFKPASLDIELVLSRSSALTFKTVFDEATMRVTSHIPDYILNRDIDVKRPVSLKPKKGGPHA